MILVQNEKGRKKRLGPNKKGRKKTLGLNEKRP